MLVSNGYLINEANKCIYYKSHDTNTYVIICLYVDDMLIFGTSMNVINETKNFLASNFDMKGTREADVILGIKIVKCDDSPVLSQERYIEKFFKKFGFFDCKLVSTPYDTNTQLKKNTSDSVSQSEYAKIIGSRIF